jgi:APA family basic amino acid/polyamine antiporter
MSHRIGFLSIFFLVTASQIGSGVFMQPANLAAYGLLSLGGWAIASIGAITLALVFAKLCSWFPRTGGPHVYIKEAFGVSAAFFTGWTYWVVSWVSTTAVIIASVGYILPLLGCNVPIINVLLEIILLSVITSLNFYGITTAGRIEWLLTIFKIILLVIVPILALYYFSSNNFMLDAAVKHFPISQNLGRVALICFWGFIGLETATTAAGEVKNPARVIPLAVISGTLCVALLYLINALGTMGVIPGHELVHSNAPYADVIRFIIGGNWYLVVSLMASFICIGCLNAWIMTSGQIVLGLAQDGLMPACLAQKNRYEAPIWGILIGSIGIGILLILTAHKSVAAQVLTIIDFSVTAFLFIYAFCCLAFFKFLWRMRKDFSFSMLLHVLYGCIALIFCCWVIYEIPVYTIMIASLFTLTGVPFYLWFRLK